MANDWEARLIPLWNIISDNRSNFTTSTCLCKCTHFRRSLWSSRRSANSYMPYLQSALQRKPWQGVFTLEEYLYITKKTRTHVTRREAHSNDVLSNVCHVKIKSSFLSTTSVQHFRCSVSSKLATDPIKVSSASTLLNPKSYMSDTTLKTCNSRICQVNYEEHTANPNRKTSKANNCTCNRACNESGYCKQGSWQGYQSCGA